MARILVVIVLLLGVNVGHVCAAAVECAWNTTCHEINTSHNDSNPVHSTPCKMRSCQPHGPRVMALTDAQASRIEKTFYGKVHSFILQPPFVPVEVRAGSIGKLALLRPHPFPEASPPPYLANCTFLR